MTAEYLSDTTRRAPAGSDEPLECPLGFLCPGRRADDVNRVPGSKPILVEGGAHTETAVQMEVVEETVTEVVRRTVNETKLETVETVHEVVPVMEAT